MSFSFRYHLHSEAQDLRMLCCGLEMSGIAAVSQDSLCTSRLGSEGLPPAAVIGAVAEVASLLGELCACWGRAGVQICELC